MHIGINFGSCKYYIDTIIKNNIKYFEFLWILFLWIITDLLVKTCLHIPLSRCWPSGQLLSGTFKIWKVCTGVRGTSEESIIGKLCSVDTPMRQTNTATNPTSDTCISTFNISRGHNKFFKIQNIQWTAYPALDDCNVHKTNL